jgi:hypothetical protein
MFSICLEDVFLKENFERLALSVNDLLIYRDITLTDELVLISLQCRFKTI